MTTLHARTEVPRGQRLWARRLTGAAAQFGTLLRHAPLTVAFVAVLWIVGAATGSLLAGPTDALLQVVGVGPGELSAGHWWTPISSALWCADLTGYLVTTALLLTLVAPAEHRFGAAKTGLLLLITQIVGTLAGSAIVALGSMAGDEWTEQLATAVTVGASPAAIGVGLAMTSRLTTLWRRRLRLLILLALFLLVAYMRCAHCARRSSAQPSRCTVTARSSKPCTSPPKRKPGNGKACRHRRRWPRPCRTNSN